MAEYDDALYQRIKHEFISLKEEDIGSAFQLIKASAVAKQYYEEQLHEYNKLAEEAKLEAERRKAWVSAKESPENVSKGARIADSDPGVIDSLLDHQKAKLIVGQLQARVNFLGNVHFTCKTVYENNSKTYRQGA
jgi:hypothetical protein